MKEPRARTARAASAADTAPAQTSAEYSPSECPATRSGATPAFASTAAAYDALPEAKKQRLQGLKNVHSYVYYRNKNIQAQKEEQALGDRVVQEHALTPEHLQQVPDAEAPIVRTHPVTGRKGLFINEAHTSHIVGMPKAESDALLKEICQHIIKPEFQYEHHWQAGDLLMWDNIAAQHKANFNFRLPLRRLMYRTTVRGSAPF